MVNSTSEPGWDIILQHGLCSSVVAEPSSPAAPVVSMADDTSTQFTSSTVNFTRTLCASTFSQLPALATANNDTTAWSDGMFCLGAATQVCLRPDTTALIRIAMEVSGAVAMSAAVHVDDTPVAWMEKGQDRHGLFSRTETVDASFLLLSGGCRKLLVVYESGASSDAGHVQQVCKNSLLTCITD